MVSPEVATLQLQANDLCAHRVHQIARRAAVGRDVKMSRYWAEGPRDDPESPCSVLRPLKPDCSALGRQLEMQTGKGNGLTFASLSSEPFSTRQIFAGDIDIILEPQECGLAKAYYIMCSQYRGRKVSYRNISPGFIQSYFRNPEDHSPQGRIDMLKA